MKYEEIIKDLKNKIYHPVYFLQGDEPYFIDKISDYIQDNVLNEAEKSFNLTVVYGKETDPLTLLDIVRRYPMMSNYQVVILKEAQQFKDFDKLVEYFTNPLKSTVFVICHKYKTLDKRKSIYKTIASKTVVFDSKKLYDNQIPAFINAIVKSNGQKISQRASALLAEYLGNDLSKIEKELEKLALNVTKEEEINTDHIEKFIGISKDYNVFELNKALINKDAGKALSIVHYFIKNPKPNPPMKVLGALYLFFGKAFAFQASGNVAQKEVMSELRLYPAMMNELRVYQNNYSIKDTMKILDILCEYDLKSKGVDHTGSAKNELMTEMVYKILNVKELEMAV